MVDVNARLLAREAAWDAKGNGPQSLAVTKLLNVPTSFGPSPATDLAIYPNPSQGNFWVRLAGTFEVNGTLSVFAADGRWVMAQAIDGQASMIDTQARPSGIYCVQLRIGDRILSQTVVLGR